MAGSHPVVRDDTLLGACYAIGEDFGFNPFYLRLLFAFGLLGFPAIALAAYAALMALVTLTRWLVPNPSAEDCEPEASDWAHLSNEELPLAA